MDPEMCCYCGNAVGKRGCSCQNGNVMVGILVLGAYVVSALALALWRWR